MAEVLYNVAAGLISILSSSAVNELGQLWGVKDELEKLKRTVATIEAVLLHAEEQSIDNPQLKIWLQMLSEAMYEADDLVDEFSTESLRQQIMGGSKTAKKVRLFFSSSNQFAFGLKMGHRVKAIRDRLDEIATEKNKFHLENRSFVPKGRDQGRDQTHSSPPPVVVGREHDKEAIVELLLSSDRDHENVSVVSIVGIGGLGKTTLAQMVYDDVNVKNHFELKMWVCVSDDFDVRLLLAKTLESASGENVSFVATDPLKNRLHEKINGRRYLLVLDDVWNEDYSKWCNFRDLLVGGGRGSRILITTRLRSIAEMSRPIFIHELTGLFENEAWLLFKEVAFKQGLPPNPNLEAMGKEILEKCCGVPLAIKAIGGMLYFKDSESEWLLFKDKELSKIDAFKNDILPILKLSYNHLPSHYKHCFAYCCLYPKDFRIPVEDLIHQWKAQGYLKFTDPNECVQDIGIECFTYLFQLSFFQDVGKDEFGKILFCKMHDLMHDLAVSVAGGSFSASHMARIIDKTQHVSFRVYKSSISPDFSSLLKATKVRTILRLVESFSPADDSFGVKEEELDAVFCNLKRLRVLKLCKMEINTLPNTIHKLKHLRYLDLSHNEDIQKLPNSVTDLLNLQVLTLKWCRKLIELPSNITKLVNLTDLDNYGCIKLSHMPQGIGRLTRLEKLSTYVIPRDQCIAKHIGGLDELHALNKLRGYLKIKNLRYAKNTAAEFKAAGLSLKQQLEKLTLEWGEDEDGKSINDVAMEEIGMEALRPHWNLKELTVLMYGGVKPPSWLPSINNLMSVSFHYCRNIQWLPPFDQLPHLKTLLFCGLTKLERIEVEHGGGSSSFFPSLTSLDFSGSPILKGFESTSSMEELPCFPCLSKLEIRYCPNLTYLPLFPQLKRLTLGGEGIESLMETLKLRTSTLSGLEQLTVSNMKESLQDEWLQNLPCLKYLRFRSCQCKSVCGDDKDDGVRWQSFEVLVCVEFHRMYNLVALPRGLQYAATLQRLYIFCCPGLACIPEWMSKLVALQDLTVNLCAQLEERCNNNSAQDWPKISHIPNIIVGYKAIQRNGCYLL